MMATIEEQIEQAKQRVKQLEARKQKVEARKLHLLIKGKRSNDTRRKILAGALVLDMMERDEATRQRFLERLDKYLKRADDRALFGLNPLPAEDRPT
ncbi:MAG TPA: mobilization protein [Candidatus Competibacter phosphatis]|nr:mobilization protein [Candidatus Competibacter phosphatis]